MLHAEGVYALKDDKMVTDDFEPSAAPADRNPSDAANVAVASGSSSLPQPASDPLDATVESAVVSMNNIQSQVQGGLRRGRPSKKLHQLMRQQSTASSVASSPASSQVCSQAVSNPSSVIHQVCHTGMGRQNSSQQPGNQPKKRRTNNNNSRNAPGPDDTTMDDGPNAQQQDMVARVIDISYICSCDEDTYQFVSSAPEGLDEAVIRCCFHPNIPCFQWGRKEFLAVVEDVCRSANDKIKASLWGNSFTSHYTIGGASYKPEAVLDRVNNTHCIEFQNDGPSMLFTVISKNVDIDARLISVLKILNQMQMGGKRECITSFVMQTKTTSMNYRGDNSTSKASTISRRIEKNNLESLHMKLRSMNQDDDSELYELVPDNGFVNYKLLVNNCSEGGETTYLSKPCLEVRIEMRMMECKRTKEDGSEEMEIWVAQSVYVHTASGVNPYDIFIDIMNQMPRQDQTNVKEVINSMLQCFNQSNILMGNDARTLLHWITQPCALCMMVTSWSIQQGVEVVSSDIPLANKDFMNIVLSSAYQHMLNYLQHLDILLNNCKISTKTKQTKYIADSFELFRGAYVHPELDKVIYCPLPPATFSFVVDVGSGWNNKVGVFELTNKCVFANIFNVICNPKLKPSDEFLQEIAVMEPTREYVEGMTSIEGKWVNYMINNVIEQRDSLYSETEALYFKTTGKHDASNKNYSVLMSLAFNTGSMASVDSTMNLVMHQVNDFAFYSESTIIKNTVDVAKALETNTEMDDLINEQLYSMMKNKRYCYRCMDSMGMTMMQDYLTSLNEIFQLSYTNLNLLWVLFMSTLSYSLPLEPAWATCVMVVDAACQPEVVVDKKVASLSVGGSKRDSTGFNFVQASYTQFMSAMNKLVAVGAPELVVSNSNYSDGKRKRMGLTLATMNNKEINEENTTHLTDYGKPVFISEDCHKLLADTGMAKNFMREACEKKESSSQSCKISENYNMKLIMIEEPRLLCMATNKKEIGNGDAFSMAARLRFHASGMSDECVPLRFREGEGSGNQQPTGGRKVRIKETNDVTFAMKNNLFNMLPNAGVKNNSSVEFNLKRSKKNVIPVLLFHLTSHVEQILTLSGFKLNCNDNHGVSRLICSEMNYFMFRLMEPFLSTDMNDEERFTRKQKGLMFSYTVPLHVINTVNKRILSEMFKVVPTEEDDEVVFTFDCNAIVRESVINLLYSDIDTSLVCAGYLCNITFDTVMYVVFRSVIRMLEFPNQYSLSSLVRLFKYGSDALTREEMDKLNLLKVWIQHRLKFFVTNQDLNETKPKQDAREMNEILKIDEHFSRSGEGDFLSGANRERYGRSIFLTDSCMQAQSRGDDEQTENKNMWKVLHQFLIHMPEVQHAMASFRLRKELMTPDLFYHLFNSKKMNRRCLNEVFDEKNIKLSEVLVKLGIDPTTIPSSWQNVNLFNSQNDEANRNSNVFNMVIAGQNCALTVNIISLLLIAPMFRGDNVNILHQLQQKHTIAEVVKTSMEMRIPRTYWPVDKIPTLQVDHMGEWVNFNMQSCRSQPQLSKQFFKRINDVVWNGTVPKLNSMKSTMKPFFLEELYCCGHYVNVCKRKVDGMELSDNPVTCDDYFNLMEINNDAFPFSFPKFTGNGRYIFTRIKLWCIVDILNDHFDMHIYKVSEEEELELKSHLKGSLQDLFRLIYKMKVVPFPMINHKRLVYSHPGVHGLYRDFRDEIDGGKPIDFGTLVQHEDGSWCSREGNYLVEVKYLDEDDEENEGRGYRFEIGLHHIHKVLVAELTPIYVKFDTFPDNLGASSIAYFKDLTALPRFHLPQEVQGERGGRRVRQGLLCRRRRHHRVRGRQHNDLG